MISKNRVLESLCSEHGRQMAEVEDLSIDTIQAGLEAGSMVMLANPNHDGVRPVLIGQPAKIKVNANLGTSPFLNDFDLEVNKAITAHQAGAHTVMDLSTGGDLESIRKQILKATPLPLGTVPLYSVAQKYIQNGEDPGHMDAEELFVEIAQQAKQGVDFMTLHCGVTAEAAAMARQEDRSLGIVSRGGSILARWMEVNSRENPLLEDYDRLLDICLAHNVTISLGDGLRPGAGADAGDRAQWEEVIVLAGLAKRARQAGVQVMIEGPGHVPLHLVQSQIQGMKRLCDQAPLYVLGPLPTDIAPGYDHIAGAIGGALAGMAGLIEIAGIQERLRPDFSPGYGFTAIVIALLGRGNAFKVVLAALFFGLLLVGGTSLEVAYTVPSALVEIIQALVILFLITAEFFKSYRVGIDIERGPTETPARPQRGDD